MWNIVKFKSGGFPGYSNPPTPPTPDQYKRSKHFRKMSIKYNKDLMLEIMDLIVSLDN